MFEHHIVGPPGTGKTTRGAEIATAAAERYGMDGVVITAMTRSAAAEAAGRNTPVPKENIGTISSFCYRALGAPKLVERDHLDTWNAENPALKISGDALSMRSDDAVDDFGHCGGTDLHQSLELLRARLVPREGWPSRIQAFSERWNGFKAEGQLVDFTDLIEKGLEELPRAPHNAHTLLNDEVQDYSALETKLVRSWLPTCQDVYLIGDLLQTIFDWRGADADCLNPAHADTRTVLDQSWRVPRAAHDVARSITRGLPGSDAEYAPADVDGSFKRGNYRHDDPATMLPLIEESMERGDRLMILASCGYMLAPLVKLLRQLGVPYHNPYSPERWSPLSTSGTATWRRILAFLRPHIEKDIRGPFPQWTAEEIAMWAPMLLADPKHGVFRERGDKKRLTEIMPDEGYDPPERAEIDRLVMKTLDLDALECALRGDVDWLLDHVTTRYQKNSAYPKAIMRRVGVQRFYEQASLPDQRRDWPTLGTIHSVKGGEADRVLVLPDLSAKGALQARKPGWSGIDAIKRAFYVAFTRTRRDLIMGRPSGQHYVRF